MLKQVEVNEGSKVTYVPANSMKVGDIGEIAEGLFIGLVMLRTFDRLVVLADPKVSWDSGCSTKVRKIENATVTLTFGTGA